MSETVPMVALNDGSHLPAVGFGTYKLNGSEGVQAMDCALHNGYRLLDSAFNYENEGALGQALWQSGIPREQVRITSKLPGRHQKYREALDTIEESVCRAQVEALDLWLALSRPVWGTVKRFFSALRRHRSAWLLPSSRPGTSKNVTHSQPHANFSSGVASDRPRA